MTARIVASGPAGADKSLREQLCMSAMTHFARFGFDQSMIEMSIATDAEVSTLEEFFGSVDGLRAACDDYLVDAIATAKTAAVTSRDPNFAMAQLAAISSYVPMVSYLVRSIDSADAAGRNLLQRLTDNAEKYLQAGVRAGTLKPTADPKGRARLIAMFSGGGLLLYRRMHPTPEDMGAVLRDYARDLILPALELYTYGLMSDDSMYRALRGTAQAPASE